ncbi:hypothetical protein CsSME_00043230 [Camellia sinensis var. sinensis]
MHYTPAVLDLTSWVMYWAPSDGLGLFIVIRGLYGLIHDGGRPAGVTEGVNRAGGGPTVQVDRVEGPITGRADHREDRPQRLAEWEGRPRGGPTAKGADRGGWSSGRVDSEGGRPRRVRWRGVGFERRHVTCVNSFVARDTPLQHFFNFLAPASEAIRRHTTEMAQEETANVRVDPLGDDDAVELAQQYRMERVGESVVRSHGSTMIAAPKPISQAEPDHWHIKADRSTVTAADLEAIREKYQVPAKIELLLPMSTERPSDARPGEFALYEEALKGGLRLPLPQVVVDVLNRLEVAPDQLMPNAWKILLACASAWPKTNEGAAMTVDEFFACYKASGQQETWVTLQAVAGKGLVAGLPSSMKGWRPRWFYVSTSEGVGVRTIWKVPTKSMEPRLGAAAEERVKRVKELREKEGAR